MACCFERMCRMGKQGFNVCVLAERSRLTCLVRHDTKALWRIRRLFLLCHAASCHALSPTSYLEHRPKFGMELPTYCLENLRATLNSGFRGCPMGRLIDVKYSTYVNMTCLMYI